jgi:hypothetical protein
MRIPLSSELWIPTELSFHSEANPSRYSFGSGAHSPHLLTSLHQIDISGPGTYRVRVGDNKDGTYTVGYQVSSGAPSLLPFVPFTSSFAFLQRALTSSPYFTKASTFGVAPSHSLSPQAKNRYQLPLSRILLEDVASYLLCRRQRSRRRPDRPQKPR